MFVRVQNIPSNDYKEKKQYTMSYLFQTLAKYFPMVYFFWYYSFNCTNLRTTSERISIIFYIQFKDKRHFGRYLKNKQNLVFFYAKVFHLNLMQNSFTQYHTRPSLIENSQFFFCLQCEYIGWKNNTHCIEHIFSRICLTESKVNNLCLTKISARRSLVHFVSLTLVPKNRNGKKMFYHALHKICDNTGKYGSVKTRILTYFMLWWKCCEVTKEQKSIVMKIIDLFQFTTTTTA